MKKLFYLLSISLIINGCSITGSADVIENGSNNEVIILKVPSEPDTISDDMQYANFEIEVPEITQDIYKNGSINAYIERTYDDGSPSRWSQLPQVFLNSENSTSAYISFGEGFIRVSMQSVETVEELFEMFKERNLKLVIVN
ncbi:hypothetical protein N9V49_02210 [Flavobacteriaceae bacterium]|nr:hypothetical protein [Flavobacteriaceae bacterium]MDB2366301.1 hypothetical protein [Flavobacteriaceae bacterium]MDB3873946.1 hypothetical protein [Flavobacteriaceae bacterium]MDC0560070.1 hypothetical protein [Flavobacteriaceae bacterium]MDC0928719.1 hypothetical protein [Flavobacteriaceae bacterium]|tara:strand:+ start:211 stop:636 length:426 start_codon:yes stop_codon:yes gene_type:complete